MNQAKLSNNQLAIINVLLTLGAGPSVAEVAEATGMSKAAVSANLKPLRDKGLISTPEAGNGVLMIVLLDNEKGSPAPTVTAPTVAATRTPAAVLIECISGAFAPRATVKALIAHANMTKKAAKRVVYNHAYC